MKTDTNKKTSQDTMFTTMPVGQAVMKNAIPAMIAMLMVLVYNLADTFFIGMTHDAYQVAAVSLATPVFLLFMAVGTIFGIGGTSVISRALGQGKKDFAKKVCAFCMWSCVAVGLLMTVLFQIFMNPILTIIGASEETWNYTKQYLSIVSLGGVFAIISNCFSNILRAEGKANKAMAGQIIGNMLNVILDPLFILIFKWNIVGAAIATVIGNMMASIFYLGYYLLGKSSLSISIKDFSVRSGIAKSVLSIGIPSALASIFMSVSQMIMNALMAGYGDMALAGVGVAMKVTMITGMISMGIGQGVQPLLGFSVGAKNWSRYHKIMKFSLIFSFILGATLTILCYIFTNQLVSVFLTEQDAYNYAVSFVKILLTTSVIFGPFYVLTNALQAMGAATSSFIINVSRQGLIYIPLLFILRAVLQVKGLIWAQPVADVLSTSLAIILYLKEFSKLSKVYTKLIPTNPQL